MRYRLRPGLSYCDTSGRLVFLDVIADRYFLLRAETETAFRRMANDAGAIASLSEDDYAMLAPLLVASSAPCGIGTIQLTAALQSLLDLPCKTRPRWRTMLGAGGAIVRARVSLRGRGLAATLERLSTLGDVEPLNARDATDQMSEIVRAFERTTLLLSPLDQCLPRSIALAAVLGRARIAASLVIGVKLRPFLAHSWVQAGAMLVNERLDVTRTFAPILVV